MAQNLAVTVTIGGAIAGSFSGTFANAQSTLRSLGSSLEQLKQREKCLWGELGKTRSPVLGESMRASYQKMGALIDEVKRKHESLKTSLQHGAALKAQRNDLRGEVFDTLAIGASVAVPVKLAIDYESAMADVRKVVDFKTPEGFKRLGQELQELAQIAAAGGVAEKSALPVDTQISAARTRGIVMEVERGLGFDPTDREVEKLGYDIESRIPGSGRLRFIEVKGRVAGAPSITVTRNEILYSLNKPEDFILAIVEFLDGGGHCVHYLRQPFRKEPDFGVTSVNYDFSELLARAEAPR